MKKLFLPGIALAVALSAGAQTAPVESHAQLRGTVPTSFRVARHGDAKQVISRAELREHTLFEGFEGRGSGYSPSADNWLPEGWEDVSQAGHEPSSSVFTNDLTWVVTNNEGKGYMNAFSGINFAFIYVDKAYGEHVVTEYQDEWLMLPEVTVQEEDFLFFQLMYNPGYTLYNYDTREFDCRNSMVEVNVSTDNGETWKALWNCADEAAKLSYDELFASLSGHNVWEPIYIDLADYVGKKVKLAFRYYGRLGYDVALDDVIVGIPAPSAAYELPNGIFRPAFSQETTRMSNPMMLAPNDTETTWVNNSINSRRFEWTYTDPENLSATTTSDSRDLVLPGYPAGSEVMTPSLTSFFGSNSSTPHQLDFAKMLAGGRLTGTDETGKEMEFGVANYDYLYPDARVAFNRTIGFDTETTDRWDTYLGQTPTSYDFVTSIGSLYLRAPKPYGLEYVYISVFAPSVADDTELTLHVLQLTDDGIYAPVSIVAEATVTGKEIAATADAGSYRHLMFDLSDYALTVDYPVMVYVTGFNQDNGDQIYFPYVRTADQMLMRSYIGFDYWDDTYQEWYTQFGDLGTMPWGDGMRVSGILMGLGASYPTLNYYALSTLEPSVNLPKEGGEFTVKVETSHRGELIRLFDELRNKPEGIKYYVGAADVENVYEVRVVVPAATFNDDKTTKYRLAVPGAELPLTVNQAGDPDYVGVTGVEAGATTVDVHGKTITVSVAEAATLRVFTATGALCLEQHVAAGTTDVAADLAAGVYVITVDGIAVKKVVR